MPTLLCVPITVRSVESALRDALLAREHGADLVEFRVDGYESPTAADDIASCISKSLLPCILTCRAAAEGGEFSGAEEDRLAIIRRCCAGALAGEQGPRYVDIEYSSLSGLGAGLGEAMGTGERAGMIVSTHDFGGRPADLARRLRAMRGTKAEILKIAFRARSLRDNLELFDVLSERDRPTIALGMGEFGLMSRVLAPKFGGFLTFASLRAQSATAPGQPTIHELLTRYRFRSIGRKTRVYGIAGFPVEHSMSPLVHNAGFEEVGHDAVYLPLPIPIGDGEEGAYENFKGTLLELIEHPLLDFAGCSVTIPHKERLVRLARERAWHIEEAADRMGAANTLRVTRDASGRATNYEVINTDAAASIGAIADALGGLERLRGLHVAVVGAGGAGRAVAHGAIQAGCRVTVYNRSAEAAENLVDELMMLRREPAKAGALDELASSLCEVFVNCTPVGMASGPAPNAVSIPVREIDANLSRAVERPLVLDTVYNPIETPLLVQAKELGWRVVDGIEMFVRQAGAQFQWWTGSAPPPGLFEKLVRESLGDAAS